MKKVIIGACMAAALTLGTTSCGCGDKCSVNNDSIVPTELSDSINTYMGMRVGMDLGNEISMAEKNGTIVNRKEFLKGLKFTATYPYNESFDHGFNSGLTIVPNLEALSEQGVDIDRDAILEQVRKYTQDDKIQLPEMNAVQIVFENLMTHLEDLNGAAVSPELSDSINTYIGMYAGMDLGREITMASEAGKLIDRREFIKGFQLVAGHKHHQDYLNGAYQGLRLALTLEHFTEAGVKPNRDIILDDICKYVNADSIDMTEMHKVQVEYEKIMNRLDNIVTNRLRMREGLEPMAATSAAAPAPATETSLYDSEMVPGKTITIETEQGRMSALVKESPSGLIYAIFDEGVGEKLGQQSSAQVQYRGMHADGKSFDEGEATFAPVQVIPGFGEGLMMLGEGGKAMFRIPAELGYGAQGVPQAGIAPNETLYFMVAVIDIQ